MRYTLALALSMAACSHSPDTVVHFAAPSSGWEVREAAGARLCSLPCVVGMDEHQTVVLARADGTRFLVSQDSLGPGTFDAAVRVHTEPRPGALAIRALSGALIFAGTSVMREDRVAAGLFLTGLGTAGMLASDALPGDTREELWVQRTAAP
jgi:hypothetical protein